MYIPPDKGITGVQLTKSDGRVSPAAIQHHLHRKPSYNPYVSPTQQDWDVHLPLVEFAINNAYQESTQTTPFMLHYGLHPHTPASIARRQV